MKTSVIKLNYSDGSPGRRLRVVLGFSTGNTREVYSDDHGEAVVDHSSVGQATVYVSGRAYHQFHAPGRTAVTLRT